ncbi:putative fluoride ion transporter CrcB [Meiothermus granaticius NBRC 107808]|uniref:Fluoride-specific ion channel FluC n=2 Tax=Meiothermus TaxID=65551 RepID=A0A399F806_9DEIN|nr:putative fluoride ion transporter CrcB [Meiothermus granaticius NBRC 107808]
MLGGAIGSGLRYGLGTGIQSLIGPDFPWSTLLINVSGSFLIGMVIRLNLEGGLSAEARLFLAMGVLGGYTTFSSFSYETLTLLQRGEWFGALAYALGSLVLGFLAVLVGYRLAGRWV